MQPSRILPDLQASLLCEDVRQEVTGNFIFIGVLSAVGVPQVPVTAMRICVVNRWTAGIGNFTETVKFIGPDQTTVVRQSQVKFALQDPAGNATNVTVFGQVKFETAGIYYVEVLVDDIMKLRFPLPIRIVTPPGQQAQPQPLPPSPTTETK
jgi:hypothetical protein